MEATAKARFQRISPRKARVALNLIRGKNVAQALDELRFTPKSAEGPASSPRCSTAPSPTRWQQDESVDLDALVVKTAFADMAPNRHMRRYRPRAQGRATRIVKVA